MKFATNAVAIDYLTITCYGTKDFERLVAWGVDSSEHGCEIEKAKRMQYEGSQQEKNGGGSFYWGVGDQGGHKHYLVQASGAFADTFASLVFSSDWDAIKITRVDIQLTLERPDWYKSRHLVDWLRAADWQGRKRKILAYDAGGDDTVYIGSRQSDRFCRIYVKEKNWLRVEFEYKADRAQEVARMLAQFGLRKGARGIMHRELHVLPQHPVIAGFKAHVRDSEQINPTLRKAESNTYKWFVKTVIPALYKLLNDDDVSARTRCILTDLMEDTKE